MIFGGNFKLNYLGIGLLIRFIFFKMKYLFWYHASMAFIVFALIIHIIYFLNQKLSLKFYFHFYKIPIFGLVLMSQTMV
jgi:hypothetical protein